MEKIKPVIRLKRREDGQFLYNTITDNAYTWLRDLCCGPLYKVPLKINGYNHQPLQSSEETNILLIDCDKVQSIGATITKDYIEVNYDEEYMHFESIKDMQVYQSFMKTISEPDIYPKEVTVYIFDNEVNFNTNINATSIVCEEALSYENIRNYVKYFLDEECVLEDAKRTIKLLDPSKLFCRNGLQLEVEDIVY